MAKETEWSKFKSLNKSLSTKEILVQQGYPPTAMYILMEGVVEVYRNDKLISTIRSRGEYIGEISILLGSAYSATVIAASPCTVIKIDTANAGSFLRHSPEVAISIARKLANRLVELNKQIANLANSPFTASLTKLIEAERKKIENKEKIKEISFDALSNLQVDFPPLFEIITQNETLFNLYILVKGEVEIIKNNKVIAIESEPGYYMGDVSILRKALPNATVRTRTECRMIQIPADRVDSFLSHSPEVAISIAKKIGERILSINNVMEKLKDDGKDDKKKIKKEEEGFQIDEKTSAELEDLMKRLGIL